MSRDATDFVWLSDIRPSSAKLLMLALADRCNERFETHPSMTGVVERTNMNRKTVLKQIKHLVEAGWLKDTEKRVGQSGRIAVYRVVGLEEYVTLKNSLLATESDVKKAYEKLRKIYETPNSPKNGTIKELMPQNPCETGPPEDENDNGPKNGTIPNLPDNGPKNGTGNGPKIGTRNCPNNSPKELQSSPDACEDDSTGEKKPDDFIPQSATAWVNIFVTEFGYQPHMVQTTSCIPKLAKWCHANFSVGEVRAAMEIAKAKNGRQPNSPEYLDKIIRDIRFQAAKDDPIPTGAAPNTHRFPEWLEIYPNQSHVEEARLIWSRQGLDEHAEKVILHTQNSIRLNPRWQHSQYIPNAENYLKKKLYLDPITGSDGRKVDPNKSRRRPPWEMAGFDSEEAYERHRQAETLERNQRLIKQQQQAKAAAQ